MTRLIEDIVICVVLLLGFGISSYFLIATVEGGQEYPPTAVGAFLGVAIAALVYRFLDGGQSSEFSIGALKLGGSAALLFAFTYLGGQWIAADQMLYSETRPYRDRIAAIEGRLEQRDATIVERDARISELEDELNRVPRSRRALTLDELRKLSPNDALVRQLRQMVLGQEPPFTAVISSMPVRISVVRLAGSGARYTICRTTLDQLRETEAAINTNVRLSRTPDGQGDEVQVVAARSGFIDGNTCEKDETDFNLQINCAAALELFPDVISSCAASGDLRGMQVTVGSLPV